MDVVKKSVKFLSFDVLWIKSQKYLQIFQI